MSGHKRATVRLNEMDFSRLEQLSNQVRQVEQDYHTIQAAVNQNRSSQLTQITTLIASRQNEFNQALGAQQTNLSRLEQVTEQALIDHAVALQEQLETQQSNLMTNAQALIAHQEQAVQQVLQENHQAQFAHFQAVQTTINLFHSDQERKFALAQETVESAFALFNSLYQVYPLERFYPGSTDRLQFEYENALRNLESGFLEAALLGAQQICQQVSTYRLSIEAELQKTDLLRTFAEEKATEIGILIEQNAFVPAFDLDGNQLNSTIDVDFWTRGGLSKLRQRCAGFLDQLRNPVASLDCADLERIANAILPQLEHSLSDLIAQARFKIILSQIRFNIAQRIQEALSEQGFEVQQGIYCEGDERQPYQLILSNLEGSEVHVWVESGAQLGEYELQIDSIDAAPRTEAELHQRANEILSSLHKLGIKAVPHLGTARSQMPAFIVHSNQRTRRLVPGMNTYVH
jgi:hypothetical protein